MMIRHRGKQPVIDPTAYVAPTATLVGDVRVGPRARIMYGAVLDAEGSAIEVGESAIVCENAVLRASAAAGTEQPVTLGDHVFVGPHATVLGCRLGRCGYLAAHATVLQEASLGSGSAVGVGAFVHARTVLPEESFVAPNTVAIGDPVQMYGPGDPGLAKAIKEIGFGRVAFGVEAGWTDRVNRYERVAEVRSAEFAAHADDEVLG